ncbi:EAL domain-containing protein [Undibacterium parvum]|uniref:EAL domain-containing protein n=2 Tax=Undibacterium parvum TaxID=401471 RepID=A0A3Q9BNW0_9BURK|nr:EAL domain-containing protein [Undibacterium parvum]
MGFLLNRTNGAAFYAHSSVLTKYAAMTTIIDRLSIFFRLRRIGVRLALSYALLLGIFVVVASISVAQIRKMADLSDKFARNDMQRLLNVQALSLSTEGASNALLLLLTAARTQRESEYAAVDEKNRQIDTLITALAKSFEDDQQKQTLQALVQCRAQYQRGFFTTVDQLEDEGPEAAKRTFVKDVQPALSALLSESNSLLARERLSIQAHQLQAQQDLERTGRIISLLALLAVLVAAVLAWLTTRSVVRPLARMESSALLIAGGDYAARVPPTKTEEVARVGHALNTMAIAIAAREHEIAHLAYYDALTDLPNRTQLVNQCEQGPMPYKALILMDLARIKIVNETLGFDTGDTVIKQTGLRIAEVLNQDTGLSSAHASLYRLSGNCFAILCSAPERQQLESFKDAVQAALVEPIRCGPHTVDVSLVFGIAASGEVALPVVTLLRNAEIALYAAKRSGNSVAWYSDAQEASRLSHLSLLSDLRSAVKASELQMWLQPKFALATGVAYGFEALVRWQHPQRGFISPAEFVPFAESTGYIGMITQWMLETALSTLAAWQTQYPDLSIAVNVSTHDLRDPNFAERVSALMQQYGVKPALLKLEITESGIMEDPSAAIALLHRLHDTGIALSIDDFGTGYSSLSYLQRLPVSELKIDRSFVIDIDQHPATQRLVKTIIELGHGLDLSVIAEGIETQAERDTLLALGCDAMQGYFASRPLHGQGLQNWLDQLDT